MDFNEEPNVTKSPKIDHDEMLEENRSKVVEKTVRQETEMYTQTEHVLGEPVVEEKNSEAKSTEIPAN